MVNSTSSDDASRSGWVCVHGRDQQVSACWERFCQFLVQLSVYSTRCRKVSQLTQGASSLDRFIVSDRVRCAHRAHVKLQSTVLVHEAVSHLCWILCVMCHLRSGE